jgi:TonB family protein
MEPQLPRTTSIAEDPFDSRAITVTPGDATSAAVRRAAPVLALSEDPVLLEAIETATLDLATVTVSPSADRFVDQLVATTAELALIDAAAAPPSLGEFLDSLHSQFPQLQLLLVGPGNVQHQVTTQITDGTVFRFVHKPASAQRLKLFVDAALRERQTRIIQKLPAEPVSPGGTAAPDQERAAGLPGGWLIASLGAAILIAGAGSVVWYFSRSNRAVGPIHATAKTVPSPPPSPSLSAAPALRAPAAEVVPTSPRAANEATTLAAQREAEQEAIDRAAAERSERSERERLAAESETRQLALAEQTRRAAEEARAQQIRQIVQLAQTRIASGALIEPANDSARSYVGTAMELAPDDQQVRAVSLALNEALLSAFHTAMAAGDTSAAERWLQACRADQIGAATLDEMRMQIDGYEGARLAQLAVGKALANAASAEDSVPSMTALPTASTPATVRQGSANAVTGSDQVVQESSLRRISFNTPKYPPEALMRGDTGTVEMDFTVTVQGTVTDIKVTASDPSGVFEHAAMSALARNRYEPVERDGIAVAQRVHIRMRFAL